MPAQDSQKTDVKKLYFHIYNKGIENRKLFNDDQDYQVFIGYLKDYLTAPQDPKKLKETFSVKGRTFQGVPHQPKNYFNKVELIAYSLLPDHFHLLVNEQTKGSLEKLIRSLSTRYAIYYNKKNKRTGSLFQGPYKSVKIKDLSQLLYLTRYLHREPLRGNKDTDQKVFSSYEEYLGERATSWIKPNVILSYLNNSKNDHFKGTDGYKHFVEKYELKQREREMIEGIIIESKAEQIDAKVPKTEESKSFKVTSAEPVSESRRKIPEFIATSAIAFVLLFTVGFRNVMISTAETTTSVASLPSSTPQVAGVGEEISEIEDVITEDEKPESKTMVVIKITDGSESVNIREKPTTKSVKVGKAKDGDTFELISKESEWYQIKLDDGEVAFVSVDYALIDEGKIN